MALGSNEKGGSGGDASGVLPSDSRHREDLVHLLQGDMEGAQKWKVSPYS